MIVEIVSGLLGFTTGILVCHFGRKLKRSKNLKDKWDEREKDFDDHNKGLR